MGRKREAQTGGAGYSKAFPTRLRGLLKDSQTTQAALAEHLGIARQSVAAYCSGESTPSWEGIAKIAGFFSCSSDYLLGLSEFRSHSTEEITLAQLGLNETTIEHLKKNCIPRTGIRISRAPETIDGINILLGNNSIWVWRLFEEIAKLKKHVSELENGGIDDLVEHELDVIEEQIDFSEIRNGYRLTPMEFLDFCINRLEGQFTTCVEDAIGYYHLYEKVYGEVEE